MIFPSLSDAERAALEEMAAHGPNRNLTTAVRGRLALYRLIDETPNGWKITGLGRQALHVAPAAATPGQPTRKEGRTPDHERHYGKKTRDTSWFG
jgi:hypothetical protein